MATESNSQALTVVNAELAANFLPIFSTETAVQRYQGFREFVKSVLKEGIDYGKNPGSDRDTLLKPGAEKLGTLFGLSVRYVLEVVIEDWRGELHNQPLFFYKYRCQLYRGNFFIAEGLGSCSSWEAKYRYRWVDEATVTRMGLDKATLATRGGSISEFEFAINKAETSGPYGKPAEYWAKWKTAIADGKARKIQKQKKDGTSSPGYEIDTTMYRVPNADFADIINTVDKISQKRAFIAAILTATNASEYFTQDLEDYIEAEPTPEQSSSVPYKQAQVPASAPPPYAEYPPEEKTSKPVAPEVPAELQRIWTDMGKDRTLFVQTFTDARSALTELLGDEGQQTYQSILAKHQIGNPETYKGKMQAARECVQDLFEAIQKAGTVDTDVVMAEVA